MHNPLRNSDVQEALKEIDIPLLGRRVRIASTDPSWLADLTQGFELSATGTFAGAADLRVVVRASRTSSSDPSWEMEVEPKGGLDCVPQTPAVLVSALNRWAVEQTTRHYVFHAGAVARHGSGVLLPAASFSGKSTLTAGLVQRGFGLLSDEVGAIELATGRMVGYPRALSLRSDVLSVLGLDAGVGASLGDATARMVSSSALGGTVAEDGAQLRLIVLPRFDVGASGMECERLRPGLAAMGLLESSCSQQKLKEVGLDWVLDVAGRVPCYRLTYSNLDEAVSKVDGLLAEAITP